MFDLEPGEMVISGNILGQVVISLSLHDHDWQRLEKSEAWQEVLRTLEESRTGRIRSFHLEQGCELVEVNYKNLVWKRWWDRLFGRSKKHTPEVSCKDRAHHQ